MEISTTSSLSTLIFVNSDGYLNIVERDFRSVTSFQAYERHVTHVYQLKQSNILVTIGDDEEAISPTIKVIFLNQQLTLSFGIGIKLIKGEIPCA